MTDNLNREARSKLMGRIRGANTKPEISVRKVLHAEGYRYRLHARSLIGTPDIVFTARRVAIFVHGCFWHGHSCRRGMSMPKTNVPYWHEKVATNLARDSRVVGALKEEGWKVMIIWECEIKHEEELVQRLREFLGPQRWRDRQRAVPLQREI